MEGKGIKRRHRWRERCRSRESKTVIRCVGIRLKSHRYNNQIELNIAHRHKKEKEKTKETQEENTTERVDNQRRTRKNDELPLIIRIVATIGTLRVSDVHLRLLLAGRRGAPHGYAHPNRTMLSEQDAWTVYPIPPITTSHLTFSAVYVVFTA
jgi:hypothetical protein